MNNAYATATCAEGDLPSTSPLLLLHRRQETGGAEETSGFLPRLSHTGWGGWMDALMDGWMDGRIHILRADDRPDVGDPAEGEDQLSRGVAVVLVP